MGQARAAQTTLRALAVVPLSPQMRWFPSNVEDPAVAEDPGSYRYHNPPYKPYPPR